MIYITKTIDETIWQLQEVDGLKVEVGSIQTSTRDGKTLKFKIQGGTPPHKPSSTGKVYGCWFSADENGDEIIDERSSEYYPSVFNLVWVDTTPVLSALQKTDEPSGQLIGVIITAMIKDGIKQGIDAAMAAQRDEIKTLVAATLTDLVDEMEKTAFDADDHADDIRDVVLDSFEIDDHFDITNYRDEIEEIAKEGLGDVEDNVKAALNDLIDSGKLALTLSNY
jgi:hypothetical protein